MGISAIAAHGELAVLVVVLLLSLASFAWVVMTDEPEHPDNPFEEGPDDA